ncbi:MAG: poly-gamma-glutamate system protein, partial [Calditrichaeota bacterium]|nr:poly-gamma-glutamate system protein [Calditrichota bacterium]
MTFRNPKISIVRLWLAVVLAISAVVILFVREKKQRTAFYDEQVQAAKMMAACIEGLRQAPVDSAALTFDPNRTNLIGREYSPITTTLGDLAAKRTATNPDFSALLVKWFHELRIPPNSPIAVGSSGSFPSLALATLCAAKAMNLQPLLIVSLGASTFGANRPDFTYLDMESFLRTKGILHYKTVAASFGGSDDRGGGLSEEGISSLRQAANRNHVPVLKIENFSKNVQLRAKLYFSKGSPAAFVNIGGAR